MGKRGRKNKVYSAEFKIGVIMDMREHHMGYREIVRKYWSIDSGKEPNYIKQIQRWERIYLEEGAEGFMVERRGRGSKGRPRKKPLPTEVENDLISENQRLKERLEYLEMENEYLKKLDALIRAEEQKKKQ